MPRVDIPGVGLVDFPDTMSDEEITSTIKNKILKTGPKVVDQDAADFTRGLANIVPQWQNVSSSAKTLTGVVAKKMGFDETGDEMIKSGLKGMKEAEAAMQVKESDEFLDAWDKGIGTVITDWLPYQAGAGVGSLLETLAFTGIGALTGAVAGAGVGAAPGAVAGFVSKQLVKKGIKETAEAIAKKEGKEAAEAYVEAQAKKVLVDEAARIAARQTGARTIGSTLGQATMAGTHGLGEVGGRAIEEAEKQGIAPEDMDLGRVLPAAAVHGIADFVSEKIMLGALKPGTPAGRSFIADVFKRIAVTGGKELPAEEIQTIAERYGANLSLTDAEAVKDYINTGAAAFGMSIVPGGAGAAHSRLYGKKPETQKEETSQTTTTTKQEKAAEVESTLSQEVLAKLAPKVDAEGNPLNVATKQATEVTEEEKTNVPVTNVDTTASGAGTAIPGQQAANIPVVGSQATPTGGTTSAVGQGLAGTAVPTSNAPSGTPEQQPTLTQATNKVAPPPVATPAFTPAPVTKKQTLDFNTWLDSKGISLTDIQSDAEFAQLQQQYQSEAGGASVAAPTQVAAPRLTKTTDVLGTTTTVKEKKVAKPIKAFGELTAEPSAQNYLNKNSYYSDEAPTTPERGVEVAGFDQAFDDFDSVDYKNGVLPAIRTILDKRNQEQETRRQELRDQMVAEGKSKKAIDAAVSKIKLFNEKSPLDFMSLDELVALYQEHAQKAEFEGGDARKQVAADRQEFLKGLDPLQATKVGMVYDRAFAQEVQADAVGRTTTDADLRKRRDKAFKQKVMDEVGQQVKGAKRTEAEADVLMEKRAERVAKYKEEKATEEQAKEAAKITKVKGKSKLDANIEKAVATGDAEQVLEVVADRKVNDRMTGVMAQTFQKLLKTLVVDTQVVFGEVEKGNDGKFDPATNTITLKGTAEQGYTGKRNLAEVVMHEISHSVLDHVFDNPAAFIKSLPVEKRASVQAALNRLSNHHKILVGKFGKKYNIASMKEFAAEFWSNRSFQMDLAEMASPTPYTAKENFFTTIVKTIASALGIADSKEGVTFKEIAEDLAQLISVPSEGITGKEVSFSETKKAEAATIISLNDDDKAFDAPEEHHTKGIKHIWKLLTTAPGLRRLAHVFQNDRYEIKHWQDQLDLAERIIDVGRNVINNIYTQLTLAASMGRNYYDQYVKDVDLKLEKSILDFAKANNYTVDKALNKLHRILLAKHDAERRHEKYLMTVPLNNNKILDNGTLSPADRRTQIYELIDSNINLSEQQMEQLKNEMEILAKKYADPFGSSPSIKVSEKATPEALKNILSEDNENYDVSYFSPAQREQILADLKAWPDSKQAAVNEIIENMQDLHKATTELNKIGNYWSQPVTNRVNFYNFKNYIPLKGITANEADELLNFDSDRMGKELQDPDYAFGGRSTVSDDPILQSRADATRAALRAGRKDLTQSIKNSLHKNKLNPEGQGLLKGEVVDHISFADRRNSDLINKYRGGNTTIFHYNGDGSIDILQVNDKPKLEAIRRTYKDTSSVVDVANKVTSFLGSLHTRYNYNFAPMNFVRDALTNAFTMSADMGPVEAARYIKAIAARSAQGGMMKAAEISVAYEKGNTAELERLKKTDPIARDMIEFIERGGMVSYLQGLSIKSNFQELQKELKRGNIIRNKEQLDKFIDIWTDMFELSSRSAAYVVVKNAELAKTEKDVKAGKMTKAQAEERATVRAVAYAKNLANFEQVGSMGKAMGAFYMFFRPSATGAVRAIEAVAPMFRSMKSVENGLPPEISNDPEAKATFMKNYAQKKRNAQLTVAGAAGLGMITYAMAQMLADDDELGRNKVAADNMQSWTRFARFHIPKSISGNDDTIIQIPWGFGLGAFAAAGAQLAGAAAGKGSVGDALWNIGTQISLDSFIPIPVSRMDVRDDPVAFLVDSLVPSMGRPAVEFLINKNGLGQSIYSSSNRRMGDAYTGGDRIPGIYKLATAEFAELTNGFIDWSPNTLYFLANSYADGISKFAELSYSGLELMQGKKDFDFKTDAPGMGGFLGAKSNYDAREYGKVEKDIQQMERTLNMFKDRPEAYANYVAKNPYAELLVATYNKNAGGSLKQIQQQLNEFRRIQGLTAKERKGIIDSLTLEQNIIKRNLIDTYNAFNP